MLTDDGMTFDARWRRAVRFHSTAPFLLFQAADGGLSRWSYTEFDQIVARVADRLHGAGVTPGTAVHLVLRNCPAFVAVWLAAARLGAWIVPADPASASRDLAAQVGRTEPLVGLCAANRADAYREGALGRVPVILELTETAIDLAPGASLVAGPAATASFPPPQPHHRLAVMFTSGTTSEPKGVVLTQHNYAHVADAMAAVIDLQTTDRWLVTLPLFHANAQYYCFASAIAAGASVALTANFSASRWPHQARELEATHASLFAAPIRMILARRRADAPALALAHVWFAQSLAPAHFAEFTALAGRAPRQLYGMTETIAIVTADLATPPRPDVIGKPSDLGRTIAIVDPETNEPVPPGTPGLLLVSGTRGEDLFQEYLDDPDTTAQSFTTANNQSWLRTGDMVVADPADVLSFVGRIDDVIKVGGENISLTEIEAALVQAPGVLEAAVLPKSDPIRDVVPVAFIVARHAASPPKIDHLDAWAAENLPPQSRPREWHFLPELPRTSVGKIRRSQLQSTIQ